MTIKNNIKKWRGLIALFIYNCNLLNFKCTLKCVDLVIKISDYKSSILVRWVRARAKLIEGLPSVWGSDIGPASLRSCRSQRLGRSSSNGGASPPSGGRQWRRWCRTAPSQSTQSTCGNHREPAREISYIGLDVLYKPHEESYWGNLDFVLGCWTDLSSAVPFDWGLRSKWIIKNQIYFLKITHLGSPYPFC